MSSLGKMPPVTMVSNREEDSMNTELSMSGKAIIGLIYPPPDIRSEFSRTCFVARHSDMSFSYRG